MLVWAIVWNPSIYFHRHLKDIVLLTAFVQLLTLISSYFWLALLLVCMKSAVVHCTGDVDTCYRDTTHFNTCYTNFGPAVDHFIAVWLQNCCNLRDTYKTCRFNFCREYHQINICIDETLYQYLWSEYGLEYGEYFQWLYEKLCLSFDRHLAGRFTCFGWTFCHLGSLLLLRRSMRKSKRSWRERWSDSGRWKLYMVISPSQHLERVHHSASRGHHISARISSHSFYEIHNWDS